MTPSFASGGQATGYGGAFDFCRRNGAREMVFGPRTGPGGGVRWNSARGWRGALCRMRGGRGAGSGAKGEDMARVRGGGGCRSGTYGAGGSLRLLLEGGFEVFGGMLTPVAGGDVRLLRPRTRQYSPGGWASAEIAGAEH